MSDDITREHKLAEAVSPPGPVDATHPDRGGRPHPAQATVAEQQREAAEGRAAHDHAQGHQDRLVDIGKANHSGGHSTGRRPDQG